MAIVRAKFRCISREIYESASWDKTQQKSVPGFHHRYNLQAVSGGSPENDAFFASTPTGNLSLSAVRDDLFIPGKSYYLDFVPAD